MNHDDVLEHFAVRSYASNCTNVMWCGGSDTLHSGIRGRMSAAYCSSFLPAEHGNSIIYMERQ